MAPPGWPSPFRVIAGVLVGKAVSSPAAVFLISLSTQKGGLLSREVSEHTQRTQYKQQPAGRLLPTSV